MVVACVTYMGSAAPPAGTPGGECKIAFDAAADSTAADFLAAALSELNLGRGGDQAPLDPAQLTILYKNGRAKQLKLDCYHSGGAADPWPKDDWYGAERNVDAWMGAVAEALEKQQKGAA